MKTSPWLPAAPLDATTRHCVRDTMMFEHHKWDPQVGDIDTLHSAPLILTLAAWTEIARLAEQMDTEVRAAEQAILASPAALRLLGLPANLRRTLARFGPEGARGGPRVLRFDFHATAEGWRVSEVNSDVPGGYIEATAFAATMAPHYPGRWPAGDPAAALVAAWKRALPQGGRLALVHATAYTDDRQVMRFLASRLVTAGFAIDLVGPDQIRWRGGRAQLAGGDTLDGLFRFFPAEWLPELGWFSGWRNFARPDVVAHSNPVAAIVSQSKRFPLACARLGLRLPIWDLLVPETRHPVIKTPGDHANDWVLKPALGRVGDGIGIHGITEATEFTRIHKSVRRHPGDWAAQRRFDALPWTTSDGPRYPCLGVYVVDGSAAGVYGRVAARPLIDSHAQDVAVLVGHP